MKSPDRDAADETVKPLRMNAYYYSFAATGIPEIDRILSAVACAGKDFHYTRDWQDDAEPWPGHAGSNPIEWIQNAANDAAKAASELATLRQEFLAEKEAHLTACEQEIAAKAELATLRRRVEQGGAAIDALEKEKEIYRARWLACITPEEGERLRSELAAACRRVAELDSIINYWGGDNDDVVAPEDGERICSEAIARHRATAPLPPGRNEG